MDLEHAIYKREKIKRKADELDKWLKYQAFQSDADRKHHLSMPHNPDFLAKIQDLIEEMRDEQFELDEKIKKVTKGIVIE